MSLLSLLKTNWKRVILSALVVVMSFCVGIIVSKRINWRVFVLHDSERVTIKVK